MNEFVNYSLDMWIFSDQWICELFNGSMDIWMDTWTNRYMDVWICGYVNQWMCGVWINGYVVDVLETRSLDGDMKTLVYDNYSKFISATETIKKVFIAVTITINS
jgi:hypothetical protein